MTTCSITRDQYVNQTDLYEYIYEMLILKYEFYSMIYKEFSQI